MSFVSAFILVVSAIAAAFVQSNMGFGGAVVLMNIVPLFFPFNKSVALIQCSLVLMNIFFAIRYRNKINWKILLPAMIPGTVIAIFATFVSLKTPSSVMNYAIGVVFIGLAVYNLVFLNGVKVKPSKTMGVAMGTFSGITNAFFGFAGPPIAAYFASTMDDKLEYFATSQMFFSCSSMACVLIRLASGILDKTDLPVFFMLTLGFVIGFFFGLKVMKKLKGDVFKKLIYSFIGANGIYIIVKEICSFA